MQMTNTLDPSGQTIRRGKRRQSEPQPAEHRLFDHGTDLLRPMTSTHSLQAKAARRRLPSEGSVSSLSGLANINPSTGALGLSDASQFFASTLIYGVTNSTLLQTLEQAVGIGQNELEEMRGALAGVFEQYGVAAQLRGVTINEETGMEEQHHSTPGSAAASTFSTPALGGGHSRAPSISVSQSGINMDQDYSRPLSAHSTASLQPFYNPNLPGSTLNSPAQPSPISGQDGWGFNGGNTYQVPSQQLSGVLGSPVSSSSQNGAIQNSNHLPPPPQPSFVSGNPNLSSVLQHATDNQAPPQGGGGQGHSNVFYTQ
jgi:hypothetical protein